MFSHAVRDAAFLAELSQAIETAYGIEIATLEDAERGYYGETWKITATGGVYFAKLVTDPYHAARYVRSFPIVVEMNRQGIDFISRVILAVDGRLYLRFRGYPLGLFAFVEGRHTEDYAVERLFHRRAALYRLRIDLPRAREGFGVEAWTHYQTLLAPASRRFGALRRLFAAHEGRLAGLAARLRRFAARL